MELDFYSINEQYEYLEEVYRELLSLTLSTLSLNENVLVSVALINDDMIHDINKQYRNIDRSTDVISFAFLDNDKDKEKKLKGNDDIVLGDIYISFETAIEQAKAYEHSLKREFSFLFIHGLLHLLGYDHMTKEDEQIMFPLQEEILSKGDFK